MRYYVVADIHGFYTELYNTLAEKGFFTDTEPHKLIVCGDLFDRGKEAVKVQSFISDLMERDEVILIRGNHEDLTLCLIQDWENFGYMQSHHISNGTVDTVLQLTGNEIVVGANARAIKNELLNTPFIEDIIPKMLDYYETKNYIYVHGWIPCNAFGYGGQANRFLYKENWREATVADWNYARWYNGMEAARQGVIEPNKTIVCGHWHTSYGHAKIDGTCSEFGEDADFSPYYGKGIIALDACTVHSRKVNCIVLEDDPMEKADDK